MEPLLVKGKVLWKNISKSTQPNTQVLLTPEQKIMTPIPEYKTDVFTYNTQLYTPMLRSPVKDVNDVANNNVTKMTVLNSNVVVPTTEVQEEKKSMKPVVAGVAGIAALMYFLGKD